MHSWSAGGIDLSSWTRKRSHPNERRPSTDIEVLFLLGEYHRRIGRSGKAKEYFTQVKSTKYKDENGKEKVGHPYFIKLVEDREKIMK
jgi:hypothetical protein